MSDKIYLNGIIVKAKQTQYGELLTASIKVDDLIKELQQHQKKGWVNINIKQRRTPSDKGVTHLVEVDTWEPKDNGFSAPQNSSGGVNGFAPGNDEDDTLPF